jgi:hypothetical protein
MNMLVYFLLRDIDSAISEPAPKTSVAITERMASIASSVRYCSTVVYHVSAKMNPAIMAIGTQTTSGKPINNDKEKNECGYAVIVKQKRCSRRYARDDCSE